VKETYDVLLPEMNLADLTGKLIVIEGTDGVGRSTQINLIKPWLEQQGRAVLDTGITRSELAGKGIKQAKAGHTLGKITLSLFYATDFADRLEHQIIPALRAGFVVLTDRYIYSLMARALVRAMDPEWIRNVYSFALKPDAVFYLRIGVEELIPRVVFVRGFDYWESGMDLHPSEDMYESFRKYQTSLLAQFDVLAQEFDFDVIDASADVRTVFEALRQGISRVLSGEVREPLFSGARAKSHGDSAKLADAVEIPSPKETRGSGEKDAGERGEAKPALHALAGAAEGDAIR